MSARMIEGLFLSISGIIISSFSFFYISSGKSKIFNRIMEDIVKERRKYNENYTSKDFRETFQAISFFMLIGSIFALIVTIVNKGEVLVL